jgi:hypothetical protein
MPVSGVVIGQIRERLRDLRAVAVAVLTIGAAAITGALAGLATRPHRRTAMQGCWPQALSIRLTVVLSSR